MYLVRYKFPGEIDWRVAYFNNRQDANAFHFRMESNGFELRPLIDLKTDEEV